MKKLLLTLTVLFVLLTCAFTGQSQNDLNQKLMMGYQGWFLCRGDNAAPNEWRHWFQSLTDPSAAQLNVDMWPDMSEYTTTYATNMNYPNGSNARLFSSHDASTTNLHFKWMMDYNVYGVYLQRFLGEIGDQRFFQVRNNVLQNVINASSTYGRHFAIMYDLSGVPDDGNLYNKLITDWEYLVNTYNVTNRTGYVKQEDRPVLAIWGIGFRDRGLKPETFEQIINYFHNTAAPQYRAYVVGGVPDSWRTLNNDSESDPRWLDIYRSLDMISPWAVGRYGNVTEADSWKTNKIIPDMNDCNANGVDYMPVIFPGFSWYNMHDGQRPLNQIPRAGGDFYWRQAYNAISAGSKFVYVAMFDEVDEGTAMFKIAATNASAPSGANFVTLDEDGQSLPSDWYLRLANESQKMLDGSAPLTSTIPISPNNNAPVITSSGTATGMVGSSFSYTITASNSPTSYAASGLPGGLTVNTSSGLISGTPNATGTFNATVTATNSAGTGSKMLTITINSSTPVTDMAPNPFIRHMYTADPSAHVWADGRLYVYPSTDIAPPRGADLMDQYHVFSTDDMVNWVDHGEILRASQVPWGRPEGGFMWAPDCAYKNGTYYFYFPHPSGTEWNTTWKIGIATSSSPASGFTVQGYIPGLESHIDPCVFTDDDGQAYFYYGGGGVCKGGKLKANMIEIDGAMQNMEGLVDFHEATWVHKRNGIYYLSYSDNHDVGDSHNQMRYATSTSPLGPWTHRGIYMDPTDSYTNHGSIIEYKGQWYSFYHNSSLSGNDWLRSICVDKLFYNTDGTIQKVVQTRGHGTPYGGTARAIPGTIQAEDYDVGGPAFAYSDHDAANTGGQYRPNEGVDIEVCGEGGFNVGWINNGEWLEYTVNVANAGSYTLNLRVASEAGSAVQVEFNGVDKTGVWAVPVTAGWQSYTTISKTITLDAGQQYMRVLMRGGAFNFNYASLTFNGGSAPSVTSSETANGTVGQPFTYNITATNSPTSYNATSLPPGLSVNQSTGLISGTPTTTGTFSPTISATNASGTGNRVITITIAPASSHSLPGTVQAEAYCAMTGIQVENTSDTGGGQNVGFIDANDYLDYCVSVESTGTYTVTARIASPNTGGQFQLKTGSTILTTMNVPNTSGWQVWQNITGSISLTAGSHVIRLQVITGGFNINWLQFTASTGQSPYGGTPHALPGTVQAENFDNGGEGVAYHDIDASNTGSQYRTGEGVDIEACAEGGFNVGWLRNTEWLEYTVNVGTAGVYSVQARVASGLSGRTFHIEIDGINVTGSVSVPNTGGWQTWQTVNVSTTSLTTGQKIMRIVMDSDDFNLNYLTFSTQSSVPVVNNTSLPSGTQNSAYSVTITATNSPTSFAASGLPSGLSINSSSGVISGTPTTNGTFNVNLSASNAAGTGPVKTLSMVINPVSNGIPVINNTSLPAGSVGNVFSATISATNAPTSFGATGLPVGLSVNTSTGTISGTPTRPGNYSVQLSATNSSGTGSKTLSLDVTEPADVVSALRPSSSITVNGTLSETSWNLSKTVSKNTVGTGNNTVTFGVLWDDSNLYIGVHVQDANLFSDSSNPWEDDAIEIYIDANNNKLTSYDDRDNQVIKNYNKNTVFTKSAISGLQHAWATSTGGYNVEIAVPWSQLNISAPANGRKVGFDVGYDDDDNGGDRDAQAVWNGTVNNYQNTSGFGTVVLSSATAGSPLAREGSDFVVKEFEESADELVSYWPNEIVDELHIRTDGSFHHVEVVDLLGRSHLHESVMGKKEISLDVRSLTGGMHLVKLRGRDSIFTFRILKKR